MKGRCEICGKTVSFGHNVSHSNRKTNRMWRPNVLKAVLLIKGQPTRVHACTRCIRTNLKHAAAVYPGRGLKSTSTIVASRSDAGSAGAHLRDQFVVA